MKVKIFEKLLFPKIDYLFTLIGILKPRSIKIERGMKKYFRGLILRFFGLMGSSLVPGDDLPTRKVCLFEFEVIFANVFDGSDVARTRLSKANK